MQFLEHLENLLDTSVEVYLKLEKRNTSRTTDKTFQFLSRVLPLEDLYPKTTFLFSDFKSTFFGLLVH